MIPRIRHLFPQSEILLSPDDDDTRLGVFRSFSSKNKKIDHFGAFCVCTPENLE